MSGDGAQAQAQGYLKNAGQKDSEAEVIQGSYSYTAPDGKSFMLNLHVQYLVNNTTVGSL